MGVLSCSRTDCINIMCDTYIDNVGYICRECKEEFKKYLNVNNLTPKTNNEIKAELICFMKTEKDSITKDIDMDVDYFFNNFTQ